MGGGVQSPPAPAPLVNVVNTPTTTGHIDRLSGALKNLSVVDNNNRAFSVKHCDGSRDAGASKTFLPQQSRDYFPRVPRKENSYRAEAPAVISPPLVINRRWDGGQGHQLRAHHPPDKDPHPRHFGADSLSPFTVELMGGLDFAQAVALRNACYNPSSMLQCVLVKIHYQVRLVDASSNIDGGHCDRVVVKKLHNTTNDEYSIIFEYSAKIQLPFHQIRMLQDVFAKHKCAGFLEWLRGDTGWKYDTTDGALWKQRVKTQLNILQGVHTLFAVNEQKYFNGKSGRMTWRKQKELTDVVSDIRVWIETIEPQTELTRRLLRNSRRGPDSLVHWAHHHPNTTQYPLTVVTELLMTELVEGIITLFQNEFRSASDQRPLGTRWSERKKSSIDFDSKLCPEWTEEFLVQRLNGKTHDEAVKENVTPPSAI